jgi:hypothetical protein
MQLIAVDNPKLAETFIAINAIILKDIPNYVQPLAKDVAAVFDEKKNKAFRKGTCQRWILVDNNNAAIGRIAAFYNKAYKNRGDQLVYGGFGFFDCINNQEAANLLLNAAQEWLITQGCEGMDGPINFGERDKWWGLVVEGFDAPLYNMNFNAPYYKELIENFGAKVFFGQLCFGRKLLFPMSSKLEKRHNEIKQDGLYHFKNIEKNNLAKYAEDFATVYNKAWAGHGGNKKIEVPIVKKMFATMKPVMDEKIMFFLYHKEEPIGIFVNLPDLNFYFKHLNGKFGWWQKLKFLFLQKTKKNNKAVGIVFGIVPEYQGKGVDSYFIYATHQTFLASKQYTDFEMQWIGDFNPKMVNVAQSLDTHITRKLHTYRYHFNKDIPVERHPIF